MPSPFASTVIGVLNSALRLVENCCHIPANSPALKKLRQAVHEVTAELEVAANNEAHFDPVSPASEDFYRRPD